MCQEEDLNLHGAIIAPRRPEFSAFTILPFGLKKSKVKFERKFCQNKNHS